MSSLRFPVRPVRATWRMLGALALLWWGCVSCASHGRRPQKPPEPAAAGRPGYPSSRLSATATVGSPTSDFGQILVPKPALRPTTPTAIAERRVGVVRMIGAGRRFVLIEAAPSAQMALANGQELRCRTSPQAGGAQSALVRVSRERRLQFIVADVLDGQPNAGDSVYLAIRSASAPAAASSIPPLLARPAPDRPAATLPGSAGRSLFEGGPANP